ncbi:MAG: serine/threonine-protein kinase [Polyangiales bacterium]
MGADVVSGLRLGDRWELISPIDAGAMGTVWHARDASDGSVVAAKIPAASLLTDAKMKARFLREVAAGQRVQHANVVRVLDHGETDGTVWMVMERLYGESLLARLRRSRLSVAQCLDVVIPVVAALGAVHGAGVVHRDVKPGNVFLCADGAVKLIDFGIARVLGDGTLTAHGDVVGTVRYASPEQCLGYKVGPPADLYALGVVLFLLLTGRPPFVGEPDRVLVAHATQEPPRVRDLAPEVPPLLDALVQRLLAKQPSQRPADAALLLGDLQVIRRMVQPRTPLPPSPTPPDGTVAEVTVQQHAETYRLRWELDRLAAQRDGLVGEVARLEADLAARRRELTTVSVRLDDVRRQLDALKG